MSDLPFLSVVVPTYNRCAYLEPALMALFQQTYPADRYEVIVVDDASTDETPVLLEQWQPDHPEGLRCLRQERNRGPAAARNLGVAQARGETIAFTDDDCIVAADWLAQIQRGLEEPGVAGVGGRVVPHRTDSAVERYQARYSVIAEPGIRHEEVLNVVTANAAFRRAAESGSTRGFGRHPELLRR